MEASAAPPLGSRLARLLGLDEGRCPGCLVPGPATGDLLCPDCLADAKPRLGGYCPMCGALYALEDEPPHLCGQCLKTPRAWERLYFYGVHAGLLRSLILEFKFGQGLGRTRLITGLMCRALGGARRPDLVVPVPLHDKRLAWRGFNQSLELARGVARNLGAPLAPHALARVRNTVPQTRLGGRARLENLRGAFAARPGEVKGKSVLLVDDVATTGSTLQECAKTLRAAGCAEVRAVVAAKS